MEEKRLIAGSRPVWEALQAGTAVSRIIVQQGLRSRAVTEIVTAAKARQIAVEYWPKNAMDKRDAGNHQGVIAEVPPFRYTPFEELLAARRDEPPFLVVLDHLQDPHNVGAIVRTAYAAGCHGLILPERRAAGMTPAAVRTSAGAAEYLPVARVVNVARCLEQCREAGMWIYGADMDGELLYTEGDYKGPLVLVIGSEGEGLGRLVKEKCDYLVRLPMQGRIKSLNASVAAGLLMYEVYRQRAGLT